MKKTFRAVVLVALIITISFSSILLATAQQTKRPEEEKSIQSPPEQVPPDINKPRLDYMSTFLSRTTSPLGLKEDNQLRQFLKQSRAKWAIRAGLRHILN